MVFYAAQACSKGKASHKVVGDGLADGLQTNHVHVIVDPKVKGAKCMRIN